MEKLSGPVRALAVVAMAAAALGGCSNGDSGTPAPDKAEHASPTPATGGAARLTLRSVGGPGKILADGEGRTLYLFQVPLPGGHVGEVHLRRHLRGRLASADHAGRAEGRAGRRRLEAEHHDP